MSPTEENYLAYRAGIQLKNSGGTSVGDLATGNSGELIGTFIDTYYNEADGTHPATAITSGSTTYNLRQREGEPSFGATHYRRPIGYHNGDLYQR